MKVLKNKKYWDLIFNSKSTYQYLVTLTSLKSKHTTNSSVYESYLTENLLWIKGNLFCLSHDKRLDKDERLILFQMGMFLDALIYCKREDYDGLTPKMYNSIIPDFGDEKIERKKENTI